MVLLQGHTEFKESHIYQHLKMIYHLAGSKCAISKRFYVPIHHWFYVSIFSQVLSNEFPFWKKFRVLSIRRQL